VGAIVQIRPGYIVVNASQARGGITYRRTRIDEVTINAGCGVRARTVTTKEVDHVTAAAAVEAVVKRADYICRKNCAWTMIGWFATEEVLPAVMAEFDTLRDEAAHVNARAQAEGSQRRAYVNAVPARVDTTTEECAREIARTVRGVLGAIQDALHAGDIAALHAPLIKAKNLDRLTIGLPGEAVRNALATIAPAKRALKARIAQGESPESAGRALDLGAFAVAISWFEEGAIAEGLTGEDPITAALAV